MTSSGSTQGFGYRDWMTPEVVAPTVGSDSPTGKTVDPDTGMSSNKSDVVKRFHLDDDVDFEDRSHHHTLGYGLGQAAPGKALGSPDFIKPTFGGAWGALSDLYEQPGVVMLGNKVIIKGTYVLGSGSDNRVLILQGLMKPRRIMIRRATLDNVSQRFDILPNGDCTFVTGSATGGSFAAIDLSFYVNG